MYYKFQMVIFNYTRKNHHQQQKTTTKIFKKFSINNIKNK